MVPPDVLLLYRLQGEGDFIPATRHKLTGCHNVFFLSWGSTGIMMNLYFVMNHIVQKGIKRLFYGLLMTNLKLMFCLPLHWLYIVFYHCLVFILFDFFLICLWFLTRTGSNFLCLGVDFGVGGWGVILFDLCDLHVSFHMPPLLIFLGMRTEHKYKLLQFFILCLFVSICSFGPRTHTDQRESKILLMHS